MKSLSKTRRRIALFTPLTLLTLALLVLEPVTNAEPLVSNHQQQQHQQPFSGTTDKQLRHVKKVAVIGMHPEKMIFFELTHIAFIC